MTTFTINADAVRSNYLWPKEVLYPRSNGYDTINFTNGDYSFLPFTPKEGANFIGNGSKMNWASNWMAIQNASFSDFCVVGGFVIRPHWGVMPDSSTRDLKFSKCIFNCQVRARFGAYNLIFENCDWHRRGIIPNSDCIGLYFSNYKPNNSPNFLVSKCTFAGFTDGIQCDESLPGSYEGCCIEDCDFFVWPEHYINDKKQCVPGIENGIDLKCGGTSDSHFIIRRCQWRGFRPIISQNGGGVGYGFTSHVNASFIDCEDCIATDSEVAVNQNSTGEGIIFNRLIAYGIKFHGAPIPDNWIDKVGCVWTGSGKFQAKKCRAFDYERLKQFTVRDGQVFID